jgi:transposase-like protein
VSKTTKRKYEPAFKMAVALEAIRGEKTLSQVASEHGVAPSLACARRDQLEQSAGDVFGKTQQDRDRKRSEEAAQRKYDGALKTTGQPAVERDFLQRFCERNGYDPKKARDRL